MGFMDKIKEILGMKKADAPEEPKTEEAPAEPEEKTEE